MEALPVLYAWLNSRQPYAEGVALVQQLRPGHKQLHLLHAGENAFTRSKLRAALQTIQDEEQALSNSRRPAGHQLATSRPQAGQKLATKTPGSAPEKKADSSQPATIAAPPQRGTKDAPELVQLRARRLADFKRAAYLKARLELMETDEQRYHAAGEIKQLWQANAKSWDDERYFLQFGFLPPQNVKRPPLDTSDVRAVTTRRNTLRTYLVATSKRGTPEKRAEWTAELLDLNRILDYELI